jgi:hypothetical protein
MEIKQWAGALITGFAMVFAGGEAGAQATEGVMPVAVGVVRVDADF